MDKILRGAWLQLLSAAEIGELASLAVFRLTECGVRSLN